MKTAESEKIRHAYTNLFNTPDGQIVLNDLKEELTADTLIFSAVDGKIDSYGSIAAAGYHKAYLYILSQKEAEDAIT